MADAQGDGPRIIAAEAKQEAPLRGDHEVLAIQRDLAAGGGLAKDQSALNGFSFDFQCRQPEWQQDGQGQQQSMFEYLQNRIFRLWPG